MHSLKCHHLKIRAARDYIAKSVQIQNHNIMHVAHLVKSFDLKPTSKGWHCQWSSEGGANLGGGSLQGTVILIWGGSGGMPPPPPRRCLRY